MPKDGPIVVLGATGNQGSAVLQHLYTVQKSNLYGVSRDINGNRAKRVEAVFSGCLMIRADLEDKQSLKAAFRKIDNKPVSVFAMSTPSLASKSYATNAEAEVAAGLALIEAAKEAEVAHLVFSSVCSCDKDHAPAYFKSKLQIEEALKQSGLRYTILRPTTFIEIWERVHGICRGKVPGMVKGDVRQQWVSLKDMGAVAALVLLNPDQYVGKTIDLVGDIASGEDIAKTMSKIRGGEPFSYSIALFTRIVMYYLASMVYEERVTFQNDGGFSGDTKPLKEIADKFPDEFKRKGPLTYERFLLTAGYDKKVLPRVKGLGVTLLQFVLTAAALFVTGYVVLPLIVPEDSWLDIQRRWAFYGLCFLLFMGLLLQFLANRSQR